MSVCVVVIFKRASGEFEGVPCYGNSPKEMTAHIERKWAGHPEIIRTELVGMETLRGHVLSEAMLEVSVERVDSGRSNLVTFPPFSISGHELKLVETQQRAKG